MSQQTETAQSANPDKAAKQCSRDPGWFFGFYAALVGLNIGGLMVYIALKDWDQVIYGAVLLSSFCLMLAWQWKKLRPSTADSQPSTTKPSSRDPGWSFGFWAALVAVDIVGLMIYTALKDWDQVIHCAVLLSFFCLMLAWQWREFRNRQPDPKRGGRVNRQTETAQLADIDPGKLRKLEKGVAIATAVLLLPVFSMYHAALYIAPAAFLLYVLDIESFRIPLIFLWLVMSAVILVASIREIDLDDPEMYE